MTLANSLPLLGVALTLDEIEATEGLLPFIRDRDRDVEIRDFIPVGGLLPDAVTMTVARARRVFGEHRGRVGIHGPYEGLLIDTPDPDIRAIVTARMLASLEALAEINGNRGGGHMVVHSPYTTWVWHNRGTPFDDSARIKEAVHLCLKPVVRRAEETGITLVIENCEDIDPMDRVALAASFESPAVRVSLDTGHAHYAHGRTGAPPVDVFVRAAGPALAHCHLQDADGFGDRHWQIGEGTIRWPSVFRALAELPVPPRMMLELGDPRWVLPSARWLGAQGLAE